MTNNQGPQSAADFLQQLRPGGPSVLTAIVPDGGTTTVTVQTADAALAFVHKYDGKRNLYYSVNPTRQAMSKKAAKVDIAAVEYALADLDPNDDETSESAKTRYLQQLNGTFEPKPTAIIDSGNGIQCIWRLDPPIALGEPIKGADGKLAYSEEDQAKIADVEARVATVMLRLGSKAGTQNIDRILRLPGTTNLPNKRKVKDGRVPCPTRLISFNGAAYPLDAFPLPDPAEPNKPGTPEDGGQHSRQESDDEDELERTIRDGGGQRHGQSRSEAMWFVVNEMLKRGYAPTVIVSTLLDRKNAISQHIYDQADPIRYAHRQVNEAKKKSAWIKKVVEAIEIRPGDIETYKVSLAGGGVVVVGAEELNDFRYFNRVCIAMARRSFLQPDQRKENWWALQVDAALRAAKPPENLLDEVICWHGSPEWKKEPPRWSIRERILEQGVGLLSGSFSMFKSFHLLDLAGSWMTGLPWLGAQVVRRGGVLIFAPEGAKDIPMRMAAVVEHKLEHALKQARLKGADLFNRNGVDLQHLPFAVVPSCRPLLDPRTVDWIVAKAAAAQDNLKAQFGMDLVGIAIDTMSAAAGWESESDAAQVQIVMNHLADVSKATNTFVLAADHFGKDQSQKSRGSSVKESSADTIMDVLGEKREDGTVDDTRLVLRKQRSGPQGLTFPFEAQVVDMGLDQFGEPLTSRIINWNVTRPEKIKVKPRSQSLLEQVLTSALSEGGEQIKVNDIEGAVRAVRKDKVRFAFKAAYQVQNPDANAEAIGEAFRRALRLAGSTVKAQTLDGVEYLWPVVSPF
jgi:hypothetical protein